MFSSRTMPMITKKWRHIPLNHWLSNSLWRKAFFLWIIINRWLANNYDLFNYGSEPAQWRCKDKTIKLTLKNFSPSPLSLSFCYCRAKQQNEATPTILRPQVSQDTYRRMFNTEFNLGFGLPRSDTCTRCEGLDVAMKGATGMFNLSYVDNLHSSEANVE